MRQDRLGVIYKTPLVRDYHEQQVQFRRQRTSETVAGIVPYESSLVEHGLKFPEARGGQCPYVVIGGEPIKNTLQELDENQLKKSQSIRKCSH